MYWQTNCWWSVQFSRLHSVLLDIMHFSSPVKSVGSSPSSQLENLNSVSSTHLNLFWCVDPPIQINLLGYLDAKKSFLRFDDGTAKFPFENYKSFSLWLWLEMSYIYKTLSSANFLGFRPTSINGEKFEASGLIHYPTNITNNACHV